MGRKGQGSNYHPARISGRAKKLMEREANKIIEETKRKSKLNKLDISKPDWSI